MSAESQQALEEATGYYRATGDAAALQEAAQAHLDAMDVAGRTPETVEGEYRALQEFKDAGEPYDSDEFAALSTEVTFARQARAYAEGNLPGGGHVASAGIGA